MKKLLLSVAFLFLGVSNYAGNCNEYGAFVVGADWLYWKPFQDNLEFASQVISTSDSTMQQIDSIPIIPNFNVASGFRVEAAYSFCNGFWEIATIYTRFSPQDHGITEVAVPLTNQFLVINTLSFPLFTILDNTQFSSLTSFWRSPVNYLDVDLSRLLCVCPWMEVIPHMGLRGVWIREELAIDGVAPASGLIFSNLTENFSGYGLEGGFNARVHLGCGFSFRGHLGGALLYARIKLHERLTLLPIVGTGSLVINAHEPVYHLSPMVDGYIGLEYQHCLCSHLVELHLGWEQHIIMNLNHFAVFNFSDLTLQGLTLGGSISF